MRVLPLSQPSSSESLKHMDGLSGLLIPLAREVASDQRLAGYDGGSGLLVVLPS